MLKKHRVSTIYRTDVVETYALRDASLEVSAGDCIAVMGPSGSGKTAGVVVGCGLALATGNWLAPALLLIGIVILAVVKPW